ncbi:MAG: thiamine-phosphate kinase [Planctomycetota bacterium]
MENNPKSESILIHQLRQIIGRSGTTNIPADTPRDLIDDMAVIEPGQPWLWTVDTLMDGVDFNSAQHGWYDIGRKAMAANLSDCAAMATRPVSALCALILNENLGLDDALNLMRGAHECGLRYACPIGGGDTNSWQAPTAISITIAARPEAGRQPVCRDGARPGDRIYVSGALGGSILGRHMSFEPRIETALAINRQLAPTAMIDISDGLAIDLWRILEASDCGATIDVAALDAAVHQDSFELARRDGQSPREHALYDGEDFELIVALPNSAPADICASLGLLLLGQIEPGPGLFLTATDGQRTPIERRGWEHFR